ncbi:hypothetical protein CEXT_197711 [Caerostris extrusa]|uniref:Uncharacterized protein n=1 Tax=Caerostris extrusa TaxID=172846 RepID=A0AAV4XM69_CAEEX|nr:hypothetical protein CEXT_197711 [Caerostris extrusa]
MNAYFPFRILPKPTQCNALRISYPHTHIYGKSNGFGFFFVLQPSRRHYALFNMIALSPSFPRNECLFSISHLSKTHAVQCFENLLSTYSYLRQKQWFWFFFFVLQPSRRHYALFNMIALFSPSRFREMNDYFPFRILPKPTQCNAFRISYPHTHIYGKSNGFFFFFVLQPSRRHYALFNMIALSPSRFREMNDYFPFRILPKPTQCNALRISYPHTHIYGKSNGFVFFFVLQPSRRHYALFNMIALFSLSFPRNECLFSISHLAKTHAVQCFENLLSTYSYLRQKQWFWFFSFLAPA